MSPSVTPKTPPSFVSLPDDKARRLLDTVLGQLSPVQRQILVTHLRGQEDPDRIAGRLGLSRDTTRASLTFAMAQLRMVLSDAPLDKTREDWLRRCRDLLAMTLPQGKTPTIEIELPFAATADDVDEDERGADASTTEAPAFLVVESRDAPTPLREVATPAPIVLPEPYPSAPVETSTAAVPTPATPDAARVFPPGDRAAPGVWPRLRGWLALLVLGVGAILAWSAWGPGAPHRDAAIDPGPRRVPPLNAPAAPLTAPDFRLVLLRQQHPGLLEELDFHVWLAEQEAVP